MAALFGLGACVFALGGIVLAGAALGHLWAESSCGERLVLFGVAIPLCAGVGIALAILF